MCVLIDSVGSTELCDSLSFFSRTSLLSLGSWERALFLALLSRSLGVMSNKWDSDWKRGRAKSPLFLGGGSPFLSGEALYGQLRPPFRSV